MANTGKKAEIFKVLKRMFFSAVNAGFTADITKKAKEVIGPGNSDQQQ